MDQKPDSPIGQSIQYPDNQIYPIALIYLIAKFAQEQSAPDSWQFGCLGLASPRSGEILIIKI